MSANKGILETILNPSAETIKNLDKVDGKLDELDKTLDSIADKSLEQLSKSANDLTIDFDKLAQITKNLSSDLGKVVTNGTKGADQISGSMKNIEKGVKAISFKATISNFRKIFSMASNFSQNAVDYIEDLNLLKVAFGDTADEAFRLVDNIAGITGFDEATLTRNLGTFRNLTSTLGTTNQVADLLAMNLEKMSLDISSLYNVGLDRSAYALTGMLTGQPRTIKTLTGANITQNALQEDLLSLGIEKNVRELNKAEKAILSYISLEKQLMNSNGDMARTLEQPAQLLRVFREQLQKTARSIGSLLIPAIQAVIPYLTAFLMAFNEIINGLLVFWKIDADSFWAEMTAGAKETATSIGSIGSAANKAKKGLRNFDKLNVITTPTNTGTGSGTGIGGDLGIDDRLLKALKDYDLHLDKIKTKAVKIKNQTMKLLGFHEELNEETGKWEWKYDGIGATIKNLGNAFLKLNPKAKILVGYIAYIVGSTALNGIKKLVTAFGKTGLGSAIGNLLKPTETLAKGLFDISKQRTPLSLLFNTWSDALTNAQKFGTALVGGGIVYTGLQLTQDGIKKIYEESNKTFGYIETGVGILGSIIGGTLAGGAVGGAAGGLIGGILGGIAGIIKIVDEVDTHLNTNLDDIQKTKVEVDKLYSNWKSSIEELQETYKKADTESDYYQRLWQELQGITDENGKIKKGYEERAKVITTILSDALGIELDVVDGNIQKWKELQGEIDNYILKRKNAMKLSTLEKESQKALDELAKAQEKVVTTYNDMQTAEDNLYPKLKKYADIIGISTDSLHKYLVEGETTNEILELMDGAHGNQVSALERSQKALEKQVKAVKEANENYGIAQKTLDGYRQTIKNYETALGLSLQNNQEALDKFFDHEQYLYGKSYDEQNEYWEKRKNLNKISLEDLAKNRDKYTKEDYEALKNSYETDYKLAETEMDKLKLLINTKNGEISDDMVNQWAEMGKNSENEFIANISELPDNIKKELYDKLKEKGVELSDAMQEALNKNTPKMEIEIGTKEGKGIASTITSITNKLKDTVAGIFGSNFNIKSIIPKAEGGFVDSGEIYMARENGMSEYVGRIGHKTAVANNDQIVDGISKGVANAIISTGGLNSRPIIIKADGDTNGLMNFIRFKQQEDDMQYGN